MVIEVPVTKLLEVLRIYNGKGIIEEQNKKYCSEVFKNQIVIYFTDYIKAQCLDKTGLSSLKIQTNKYAIQAYADLTYRTEDKESVKRLVKSFNDDMRVLSRIIEKNKLKTFEIKIMNPNEKCISLERIYECVPVINKNFNDGPLYSIIENIKEVELVEYIR